MNLRRNSNSSLPHPKKAVSKFASTMLPLSLLRHDLLLRRRLLYLLHHRSTFSTTTRSASSALRIPLSHPAYIVWSANTSLGKTVVSTGLAYSFLISSPSKFLYLKPLQTGFPSDSDSRFVLSKISTLCSRRCEEGHSLSLLASNSVLRSSVSAAKSLLGSGFEPKKCEYGLCDLEFYHEKRVVNEGSKTSELVCQTLYAWEEAVSPHLAAEREAGLVEDVAVVDMLGKCLNIGFEGDAPRERMGVFGLIETAGGVASPGPSGSLQCDLYRPLRLPGILVGDGRLGGISATISAYESLKLRGYDVVAVVFEDHGLANETPLMLYLRDRVPVLVLPTIPQDPSNDLIQWFVDSGDVFNSLKEIMLSAYSERIKKLNSMPKKAGDIFWWPFTQHKLILEETVTVIDSRCGENFAVFKGQSNEFITQQFDACASWWTQGPDAALQTELARDMGYAAARFGHVMFPENVYEPALECAEILLDSVGKGWASRAYFSDNGSTAIEIALKMAFRRYSCDHGILQDFHENNTTERRIELMVLALRGSYHGDTLGAMEAQAPSSYTGFLQQPWYTGRGLFLDPPTVFMSDSMWNLSLPRGLPSNFLKLEDTSFRSRDEIFDRRRDQTDIAGIYSLHIKQQLLRHSEMEGLNYIGALIIEPVIQGAGGMHMVDPLFQRVLVNECRSLKIPIIFDEVFTGFWRLGVETAAKLLGCLPDIACFGKLMTGGILPLAATLATDTVFDSFIGDSKLKALLHGHSYSGHAMGCTAAAASMKWFGNPQTNPNVNSEGRLLRELWDMELVQQISSHPSVKRVVALGTLCAIELRADGSNVGYASLYAGALIQKLREDGVYLRPLGNVIYLMCGPCTLPEICREQLIKLRRRLEELNQVSE
ncbi:bifunctional dethiobiotin synthetase/7 8-diamino-pelargonic acid aminotransferase mitochondrial [Tripterygium wilfordii]|uniref:Bifunctional dethiobiotin synthetase/7 8-diamino-pelargonic acid aminotransferase mitochondrial n=1 Tax=Tripterygium wilfordii TaxID=458696 RepID=A0A7J7DTH6_TRIWF|nr:bifunctional dethiobiotin synthetase/7,8-diamino-pelargonic acid aminotransferase, mitochondrial [Tripterygium wilfordii]KAF5749436.1 bifunctional dethiobiotin synthetase/7 8-diamino-pelargonic acid aminotransferase mitochondrial [Tripterygium wilfordii]